MVRCNAEYIWVDSHGCVFKVGKNTEGEVFLSIVNEVVARFYPDLELWKKVNAVVTDLLEYKVLEDGSGS